MGSRAEHAILVHAHSHKSQCHMPLVSYVVADILEQRESKKILNVMRIHVLLVSYIDLDGYKSLVHHALQK